MNRRFWSKVLIVSDRASCWLWQGSVSGGYGRFGIGSRLDGSRKSERSSRVALTEILGRELRPGLQALHRCHNPPCCRPSHLYEGTHADNMADKARAGRGGNVGAHPGESHHNAKLTKRQVDAIKRARGRVSQTALGKRYGVNQTTISKIQRGVRWI